MLASITPLGERGRRNRYAVTTAAFALASTAAGALVGLVLGALGSAIAHGGGDWRLALLAGVVVIGTLADLRVGGLSLPTLRRQVNEDWLHAYRGWVYGAGFGAQLGAAVATIVTTAAIYAALTAALLTGSAALGALIGGVFGAARAATLAGAAGVRTPAQLVSLHRRLAAWRPRVMLAALALDIGLAGVALWGALA